MGGWEDRWAREWRAIVVAARGGPAGVPHTVACPSHAPTQRPASSSSPRRAAPVVRRVRPHIPHPECVVHGIAQEEVAVGRQPQPRHCVCVAGHAEGFAALAQVPDVHCVVQAAAVHLQGAGAGGGAEERRRRQAGCRAAPVPLQGCSDSRRACAVDAQTMRGRCIASAAVLQAGRGMVRRCQQHCPARASGARSA